jgi:hypothetical protein
MLAVRRHAVLVFFGTLALGCGAEPRASAPTPGWGAPAAPTVTAPPVDPRIAIWADECADLIGTINAGIGFVGEAKGDAAKSDLSATADALDSVARELEPKRYTHPDLARLAAWYTGVSKGLAATTREADAALAKEDEKAAGDVAVKAEELTKQEDAIVDEINRVCEPFTPPDAPSDEPQPLPAPPASVPAPAPPASSAPVPPAR